MKIPKFLPQGNAFERVCLILTLFLVGVSLFSLILYFLQQLGVIDTDFYTEDLLNFTFLFVVLGLFIQGVALGSRIRLNAMFYWVKHGKGIERGKEEKFLVSRVPIIDDDVSRLSYYFGCFKLRNLSIKGRATKREFLSFLAFGCVSCILAIFICGVGIRLFPNSPGIFLGLTGVVLLSHAVAGTPVAIRRLHDVNRTGFAVFASWLFVPLLISNLQHTWDREEALFFINVILFLGIYIFFQGLKESYQFINKYD